MGETTAINETRRSMMAEHQDQASIHFELNYIPPHTESGRRLARR
jgi:hypothetical protein